MKELNRIIRDVRDDLLARIGKIDAKMICDEVEALHPEFLGMYGCELARNALSRRSQQICKENADIDENPVSQMLLPGTVPTMCITNFKDDGKGVDYIRWDMAKEFELDRHVHVLDKNINDSVAKRQDFDLKRDYLRPGFRAIPGCTAAEAGIWVAAHSPNNVEDKPGISA